MTKNTNLVPDADGSYWVDLSHLGMANIQGERKKPLTDTEFQKVRDRALQGTLRGEDGHPTFDEASSAFVIRLNEVAESRVAFNILDITAISYDGVQHIRGRVTPAGPRKATFLEKVTSNEPLYFGLRCFVDASSRICHLVTWDLIDNDPYPAQATQVDTEQALLNGLHEDLDPIIRQANQEACDAVVAQEAKPAPADTFVKSAQLTQPLGTKEAKKTIYHIHEWLDTGAILETCRDKSLAYAHFMFSHFREPAWMKSIHEPFYEGRKLYVDYEGKTWQVTGASRLGDIWLKRLTPISTAYYDKRIDLDFSKLSNWRAAP